MPNVIYDPLAIDFEKPGKHHYQVAFHLDSSWGYSLVPVTVINGLRDHGLRGFPPGVGAFGGTHGNEWEGQVAIKRLCQDLDAEEMCGRVILIPQLNESSCVANSRESPLDGVNMNRAFPGDPCGTISYRVSHFVKTRIFPQVQVVLDIHSGGNEGVFPICTSFHPIPDSVQRAETFKVAKLFDTPFILVYSKQMGSGLLTDEAEAEGKITVGGEFGFAESVSPKGTLHAYEGIKNVLREYGLFPGKVVKIDPARSSPPHLIQAPDLEDYIPCPMNGIWEPTVEVGAEVQEGDLLGRIHDFSDHSSAAREIHAHRSGIISMLRFPAICRKGLTLYVISQEYQI